MIQVSTTDSFSVFASLLIFGFFFWLHYSQCRKIWLSVLGSILFIFLLLIIFDGLAFSKMVFDFIIGDGYLWDYDIIRKVFLFTLIDLIAIALTKHSLEKIWHQKGKKGQRPAP